MPRALEAAGRPQHALAVGDALLTDIKGAQDAGLEALFIADGLHGEEIEPYTVEHLSDMFAGAGVGGQGGDADFAMVECLLRRSEARPIRQHGKAPSPNTTSRPSAKATGDINPVHFDEDYARNTMFRGRVAHGALSIGFISAVIGMKLPGRGHDFRVRQDRLQGAGADRRHCRDHLHRQGDPRTSPGGAGLRLHGRRQGGGDRRGPGAGARSARKAEECASSAISRMCRRAFGARWWRSAISTACIAATRP